MKVILLLTLPLLVFNASSAERSKSAFAYDLSRFKEVPAELMLPMKSGELPLPDQDWSALAVAPDDSLYLAGKDQLLHLAADGKTLAKQKLSAKTTTALALSADGKKIYAAHKDHIVVYEGESNTAWPTLGEQAHITSLAVMGERILVADAVQRVVFVFDLEGRLKGTLGEKDAARGIPGFLIPSPYFDLVPNPDSKTFWAANPGRLRVEQYNLEGERSAVFGKHSMKIRGFNGCCNPAHIARLPNGNIVSSEKGIARVKVLDPEGQLIGVVAASSSLTDDTAGHDIAVDRKGRILVLDSAGRKILTFVPQQE